MKSLITIAPALLLALVSPAVAQDLPYNSPSTGADGALMIAADTVIDLNTKPDGIFHYTTIDIAAGATVTFTRNSNNTPVVWLATGAVNIEGTVNLNGESTQNNGNIPGEQAMGGPGGFDGGLGISPDRGWGTSGFGPGGGDMDGKYFGVYGNVFLQPLIGGSGGTGGVGSVGRHRSGGAGGGAIWIASSRDITVNGAITANGGSGYISGRGIEGGGSGGAIRLTADRILGTGQVQANGSRGNQTLSLINSGEGGGRMRFEAYVRRIVRDGDVQGTNWTGAVPTPQLVIPNLPELRVTMVGGVNVTQPPQGEFLSPDVVFSAADPGTATIKVELVGQAPEEPVTARLVINSGNGTEIVDVPLPNGEGTVDVDIPAGLGYIQASTSGCWR